MQGRWPGILPFSRFAHPLLASLMILHMGLALAFASIAPWRTAGISNGRTLPDISAPDEVAHANYVDAILRTGRLPVLDPATAGPKLTYENHQPPLFYSVDAAMARLFGFGSIESPRAALLLRAPNALFGALGVAGAFFLALWGVGSRPVAVATSAIVALLPMNVAISGAVNNDTLLIALCTWTLAIGLRSSSLWDAVAVGLLAGLAVLTKFTALLLIPVLPFLIKDRRSIAIAATTGSILVLPYLLRNQQIYGHPLAAPAFDAAFHRDVDLTTLRTPYGFAHWGYVLMSGTLQSFVGEFGYMDIHLPTGIYVSAILLLFGSAVLGLRYASLPKNVRCGIWIFMALLIASYVSYNLWQVQPQARYLFPALAPFALATSLGMRRIGRKGPAVAGALLLTLVLADACALAILPHEYAVRAERAHR